MFAKDEATFHFVSKEFNRTHPEQRNPLSHSTVIRIIKRFQETGSVADRERCGQRKSATNGETKCGFGEYCYKPHETSQENKPKAKDEHMCEWVGNHMDSSI